MASIGGVGNPPVKNQGTPKEPDNDDAGPRGSSAAEGGQQARASAGADTASKATDGDRDLDGPEAEGGGPAVHDTKDSKTAGAFYGEKLGQNQGPGHGLPSISEPSQSASANISDAYKSALPALQNVTQSNGDASKINGDSWKQLAQAFPKFSSAEQSAVKEFLNKSLPGNNTKTGVGGGDALQFAADALGKGDADAAKNRLADLQKKTA